MDPSLANIKFEVPSGWPAPSYNFSGNALSVSGFELGRKLFYEVALSSDGSTSCGSCHQQFAAFSQIDHRVSHGVHDRQGVRNSPGIFNENWHTSFFWDGGVNNLELQPINPIVNPLEMDETLPNIVAKLQADPNYAPLFTKAFGSGEITSQRILKALAQFMGMMVSDRSKFDKYQRNETTLNPQELSGLSIYQSKCASCHTAPLFSDFSFRSNGLPLVASMPIDSGRAIIGAYDATNLFKFKVPTLRNLKYTAPYMHDGRFNTVNQVLDHYEHIDSLSVNLDPQLRGGIHLSNTERADLVAFLNTLNDEEFIKDIRFAEPRK